jgi:hypothetical protein
MAIDSYLKPRAMSVDGTVALRRGLEIVVD